MEIRFVDMTKVADHGGPACAFYYPETFQMSEVYFSLEAIEDKVGYWKEKMALVPKGFFPEPDKILVELKALIKGYTALLDDKEKEEYFGTEKSLSQDTLESFYRYVLKIRS